MSFKIHINDRGNMVGNDVRVATEAEANAYARDLYSRWFTLKEVPEVLPSHDPVNYVFEHNRLSPLP